MQTKLIEHSFPVFEQITFIDPVLMFDPFILLCTFNIREIIYENIANPKTINYSDYTDN